MADFTPLEQQIRECFGRVVYSHKVHEKEAERWTTKFHRFAFWQVVLSALVTSGAVGVIFTNEVWAKGLTAVIAAVALFVSLYKKNFDPSGTAQKHRAAAASLWPIRESYLSLLTDLRDRTVPAEEAKKRRDELQNALAGIYKGVPQTSAEAYADAQRALKQSEDMTFSDSEIDAFVPAALKSSTRAKNG